MTVQETIPPPLQALAGAKPLAPAWFEAALTHAPERTMHQVKGVAIETLTWGQRGKPGLLLVHGGMAHAHWWSFIAPFFAETHRVAAISLSGMGGSGWRESYEIDTFVAEMLTVMQAEGLFDGSVKPVIMGHSFGGLPTLAAAVEHGARLGGIVILDSPLASPEQRKARAAGRPPSKPPRDTLIYDTEAAAIMRFRFQPAQHGGNLFIADHIARHSLRPIKKPDGSMGVTWRFDPFMWSRLARRDPATDLPRAGTTKTAVIWGATSALYPKDVVDYVRSESPKGTLFVEIPEANHHVMVDQPLALVTALRAVLGCWSY
jgi:pimeloyl-ACP methyl ester carboxylesterase